MRTIGVVSVGRSDFGIYRPLLRKIQEDSELTLRLIASGSHLSPEFGMSATELESDGFAISERIEMLLSSDSPEGVAKSIGLGVIGFSQLFARFSPDILVVLGDRFEMYTAALAALPFKIPVAHIHGGEVTEGAIDDALRHSITKMSHLHFASTSIYAARIQQLGEEDWRIEVSGALALDVIRTTNVFSLKELNERFGLRLVQPFLLVTYHPETLNYESAESQIDDLLEALREVGMPVLFTGANEDTSGRVINKKIRDFVEAIPSACFVSNLGSQAYISSIALAAAMVGNSSSGMFEAASFKLPVVNVGSRQKGRLRTQNIIDIGGSRDDMVSGIREALSDRFRSTLITQTNIYGDGHAAERIVAKLKSVPIDRRLLIKRFVDLQSR